MKLTRVEIVEFFHHVNEFVRMNSGPEVVDAWAEKFGERYTKQHLFDAYKRMQSTSDKPPTILGMQEQLHAMLGRNFGHAEAAKPKIDLKPTRLEVCIEKLGYEHVEKEMRSIIDPEEHFSWSTLFLNKKYKSQFAMKISELFELCVSNFGVERNTVSDF